MTIPPGAMVIDNNVMTTRTQPRRDDGDGDDDEDDDEKTKTRMTMMIFRNEGDLPEVLNAGALFLRIGSFQIIIAPFPLGLDCTDHLMAVLLLMFADTFYVISNGGAGLVKMGSL